MNKLLREDPFGHRQLETKTLRNIKNGMCRNGPLAGSRKDAYDNIVKVLKERDEPVED